MDSLAELIAAIDAVRSMMDLSKLHLMSPALGNVRKADAENIGAKPFCRWYQNKSGSIPGRWCEAYSIYDIRLHIVNDDVSQEDDNA